MNNQKIEKNTTKGVCFDVSKGKYKAYVDMFGTRVSLGYFSDPNDASLIYDNFVSSVTSSHYPLATFICLKFGLSFNKALVFIASALKAYVQREDSLNIGTMFPSFTVQFTSLNLNANPDSLVSVHNARTILSIQDNATDIIFGRSSISKFRCDHKFDYDSVISTLSTIANGI